MRTIDGYLSRRAQTVCPDGLVTHENQHDYRIDRPDAESLGLGDSFAEAQRALTAMIAAHRARTNADA